ncbi:MAG: UTP--glucose-phosphate uridylyltransferase [Solirubrobacteraceae bacterium]|nr:UTP--glucose-phosphate uridylyltransferase [Solirubrobacteraceae bacterium]
MSDASLKKMRDDGASDAAIATFAHYHELLRAGEQGILREDELEPVDELPDAGTLPADDERARDALQRAVVVKLNGGLGTSMGMTAPKSLLPVKDGLSFLDITVRQIRRLRERTGAGLPLVLMNSFATRNATLEALARYEDLAVGGIALDFLQSKVPKLAAGDLEPIGWPDDPALEWAPPGHGDLYPSLLSSGTLDALLDGGYEYAFVANADNLGAVLDPRILAWFAREEIPFAMEVADRTPADRKGGHLARRREGGGLVLREVAQTAGEDLAAFQDIERHRFFNTNTLWVHLPSLKAVLDERDGVLGLPMIVNRKTVDPTDSQSPAVLQLETAMGAAIDAFEDARAIRVPKSRFAPVKTTDDLLALRSDAYVLDDDGRIEVAPGREGRAPLVELDPDHYKLLRDFDERFGAGPPSLRRCERLRVRGDVHFGAGVVVVGDVVIEHDDHEPPHRIEDGAVLEGG